mgnify:FL=1|tara:strand:+ start:38 stop:643 length:606 start_codon:yes stop_codon:yes gene_type:complete
MKLQDFDTLAQAKPHSERTLKNSDERMLNERGIFSLIGMQAGESLMQSIEASPDIPARVKAWFKPSERGIDISDPSAVAILAGMVAANRLTQVNSDILIEYAYVTTYPFANSTKHDFDKAKGTINKTLVTVENGYCTITTTADREAHSPQIYKRISFSNGDVEYIRVAGFGVVSTAGQYRVECPRFPAMYVDDAYSVVTQG